jgi:hypothetical protein
MDEENVDENEQAWAEWNEEAIKVLDQGYAFFRNEIDPRLWQDGLRFALDAEQAPVRCSRRGCRVSGACQMRVKPGTRLDCGAGLGDETLQLAARLTLFAHLAWFDRWCADMARSSEVE